MLALLQNTIKPIILLLFPLFCGIQVKALPLDTLAPLTIGEIRVIKSAILKEDRVLNVYLPTPYDSSKSYPVIYLLDGSIHEDFLHIAGLTQFFNMTFPSMPDCIVVGIANVNRKRDFTFQPEKKDFREQFPDAGYSEPFMDFLEKELKPYIQHTYAVNDSSYLIGQSLGGLLATEILLKRPELFSHYLIVSPSLWWDDERLLKESPALLRQQADKSRYVYIAVGQQEEEVMRTDADRLYRQLKDTGLKVDFNLMPEENHATILHRSIYEAFLRLFVPSE